MGVAGTTCNSGLVGVMFDGPRCLELVSMPGRMGVIAVGARASERTSRRSTKS
jgi:hypothetical protein